MQLNTLAGRTYNDMTQVLETSLFHLEMATFCHSLKTEVTNSMRLELFC